MAEGSSEAQKPAADGAAASASLVESLFKRRIEFHPARKPFSLIASAGGDFHLETLNPSSDSHRPAPSPRGTTASAPLAPGKRSDGGEFHDPELSFRITFRRIGAGLANLGNTCFLNSVLQCLTYTEPFAAYLQSGKHKYSCHIAGFCAMCALQNHVMNALQSTGKIVSPHHLVKNLRCISRNFRNSRQEDAHEYMVNLLESMHKCCLPSGVPSESPSAFEKSLVHKIFGGRLQSQVKCMQCSYCSNKFDPFLDLSLEILKADSLHKALRHFTTVETLDGGERQYQCQRCKEKVKAHKQLTIHKAPYVLMVHLKRFRTDDLGKKIDKKVDFEPTLDLKPFVSDPHNGDLKYTLYGVLVHAGWGTHSGHYYCFVRTSSGMWHSLDDNQVVQVSEKTVLAQKAYMLFYVRDKSSAIKGSAYVHKDNIPANGLRNKVIPHSATGLNGAIQNGVAERNLSTSEHSNGKLLTDSTSCGKSFSEMDNSSEHLLWKEPSFRKNDNVILKEAPVLQSNGLAIKKEASIFQSNGNFLSQRLQQTALSKDPIKSPSKDLVVKMPLNNQMVTGGLAVSVQLKDDSVVTSHADDVSSTHEGFQIKHGKHHLPNGCNAEVESGIPVAHPNNSGSLNLTSDKHTKKLLIENGMHENGDATNDINQNNDTLLQMDGCNVSIKSEPIKFSSQSSPMDGCAQKDALGTVPMEYQSDGLENGELQCRIGGESLLKLEETKAINLSKKPNSSGEILELTSTEHSVGNSYRKKMKHKKLAKFSLARGLNFGSKQLFWASLCLHKVKKHKRSKKQHASSGNMIKNEVVCLTTNDVGTSISEACGDSKCPSRKRTHSHSSSEGNIWEVNDVYVGDSMNTKDRVIHERSGNNGLMFANCGQLKRCSSSASNECSTRETDVYGKVQSQHDLMNVLMRGLNDITVARWDGIESQSSHIQGLDDVRNGNIGYVLDEWDEELDRGKRKKIKKHRGGSFGGSNQFQEKANEKAQKQQQMKMAMDRTSSGNQPFRI